MTIQYILSSLRSTALGGWIIFSSEIRVTLVLLSPGHVSKECNFCISAFSMCIREISHPLHFGSNAKLRDAKVMPLKKFHAIEGIVCIFAEHIRWNKSNCCSMLHIYIQPLVTQGKLRCRVDVHAPPLSNLLKKEHKRRLQYKLWQTPQNRQTPLTPPKDITVSKFIGWPENDGLKIWECLQMGSPCFLEWEFCTGWKDRLDSRCTAAAARWWWARF